MNNCSGVISNISADLTLDRRAIITIIIIIIFIDTKLKIE